MSKQVLLDAFARSGIVGDDTLKKREKKISKTLLFTLGLSGGQNSSMLREGLAEYLKLPKGLSANAFLDCLNAIYSYDEFLKAVELWQKDRRDAVKR